MVDGDIFKDILIGIFKGVVGNIGVLIFISFIMLVVMIGDVGDLVLVVDF